MKPAPFEYHRPQSLAEALNLLAGLGDGARPLAGGQSLVPMMNMRIARPEHLIDLNDLAGLDFIRETDATIEIGAVTRHRAVAANDDNREASSYVLCLGSGSRARAPWRPDAPRTGHRRRDQTNGSTRRRSSINGVEPDDLI